jgi:hypothetical protein
MFAMAVRRSFTSLLITFQTSTILDNFFEIASVKCLRRPGAVELHTNLISRLACSDNSTNMLGLPGHVFQTARAQSTSRTSLEMPVLVAALFISCCRSLVRSILRCPSLSLP